MKETVATTTGLMNEKPAAPKVPNMSKMKMPTNREVRSTERPVRTVAQPKQVTANLAQKIEGLTDEDKATLGVVLSPSVSNVLKKIAPELTPLLDQAGSSEENMMIPVSVAKSFAAKRYGGQNETESLSSFIADLEQSVSGMDNTMGQTNVPPDTQMADSEGSMMQSEIDEIDSGMMEA